MQILKAILPNALARLLCHTYPRSGSQSDWLWLAMIAVAESSAV